ncbi:MAG: hypothetical protein Q8807_02885 ['Waltheria sp.' little leaf phytoplasma]|nr:hypothetical protein ['Waltheria sp.' little leaf phytoplasma]
MISIKNKLSFLPLFLISFLIIFFMIKINPIIAMENKNQSKTITNYEPSDQEVNDCFQLLNKSKQNIAAIKRTIPHLKNASIKEIEKWACSSHEQQPQKKD